MGVGGLLGQPLLQAAGDVGGKNHHITYAFCGADGFDGNHSRWAVSHHQKTRVDVVSEGIQNAKQRREEERLILGAGPHQYRRHSWTRFLRIRYELSPASCSRSRL